MAIKTDCPRCKAHLQVPNKLAGGYVNCPQCKGRLWVAKDAPADATPVDAIGVRVGRQRRLGWPRRRQSRPPAAAGAARPMPPARSGARRRRVAAAGQSVRRRESRGDGRAEGDG